MDIETIQEKNIKEFEHLVNECKIKKTIYKPTDSKIQYNEIVNLLRDAKNTFYEFNKTLDIYENALKKRTCNFEAFYMMLQSISLSIDKSKLKKEIKNKSLEYLSQKRNTFIPKNSKGKNESQIDFNKSSNDESVFDQKIRNIEEFINYFNSFNPILLKKLNINIECILKILPDLKKINKETTVASEDLINSILNLNEILYNGHTGLKGIKVKVEAYLKRNNKLQKTSEGKTVNKYKRISQ